MQHSNDFTHIFLAHILPFILICLGFFGLFKLFVYFYKPEKQKRKRDNPKVSFQSEGFLEPKGNRRRRRRR